jgi:redox-sensitive bicupin YhaK (pirin superfamily)
MIEPRRAQDRGHADHGWLNSHHSFSFADYHNPSRMGYSSLRVINEDRVAPGAGFPTHSHRDMEIISYVLAGALEHRDSLGNGSTIRPGDVQRMSAGRGVRHSEYNASQNEPVHFLQIWLLPERAGIEPGYEQQHYPESERRGQLRLIASHDGDTGSVRVHQDARVYASLLQSGESLQYTPAPGRHCYVHVARGELALNGDSLVAGDAAAIADEPVLLLSAPGMAEFLLFDLA